MHVIAQGCCCCVTGVRGSLAMPLLPLTEDRALPVLADDKGKIQINESSLPTGMTKKRICRYKVCSNTPPREASSLSQ